MAEKPKAPPRYKVGDKVESFRGEKATVDRVRAVDHPGKSHRVGVTWEGKRGGADPVDYYESVFNDRRPAAKKAVAKKVTAKKTKGK